MPVLKKIWWFDCIPPEYKKLPFYPRQIKGDGRGHLCDIVGTPVFCNNRVYIAIGGDPNHGGRDSKGSVVCIDATGTGDVTNTAQVWSYPLQQHSLSTPAIADGLVFVGDSGRRLHCVEAATGKAHWTHDVKGEVWASPLVADGKVYVATRRGEFLVFAASAEKKLLSASDLGSTISGSPS